MAWAFQKDSELVGVFNYHIHKMQATGNMNRFWQEIERKRKSNKYATKMQEIHVVGYENVAFPFLALLTGLLIAFLQLGIEMAVFCKRKYADNANQSSDESSIHREAMLVLKEVCDMLQENNSNTKDIKLQSIMRKVRNIREKINQLLLEWKHIQNESHC